MRTLSTPLPITHPHHLEQESLDTDMGTGLGADIDAEGNKQSAGGGDAMASDGGGRAGSAGEVVPLSSWEREGLQPLLEVCSGGGLRLVGLLWFRACVLSFRTRVAASGG